MLSRFIFVTLMTLLPFKTAFGGELTSQAYWQGLQDGFTYLYQGSYEQFREKNNLYVAAAAIPSLWYSFEEDKRISANAQKKSVNKFMQISSDLSPALSFPLIPLAFYSYGLKQDDDRSIQFAKEYFGALYLALAESAALSLIDVHERPDTSKLSKWETNFRGDSSFPSGHVIPYAMLALKAFQFYGPLHALIPGVLFVGTSLQRIRDQKHYLSDVVGGFFLSVFASESVRKAGNYPGNHYLYQMIFEHNVSVGATSYRGVLGPKISFYW